MFSSAWKDTRRKSHKLVQIPPPLTPPPLTSPPLTPLPLTPPPQTPFPLTTLPLTAYQVMRAEFLQRFHGPVALRVYK